MPYTIQEISEIIAPIAEKYELHAVYLFGSYARGTASEKSDIDILIDRSGSRVKSMFDMGALYDELSLITRKEIDLVTTQTLEQKSTRERTPFFVESLLQERVKIYG